MQIHERVVESSWRGRARGCSTSSHLREAPVMSQIEPFNPSIPRDEVDRLLRKLKDTRLPKDPIVPDAGEDYG